MKKAIPSWSSWRAPLPLGNPYRVCSSGKQAAVLYVSWRGHLCPPPGPCSVRCYRWLWSRNNKGEYGVWNVCVNMTVFESMHGFPCKDIVPAGPDRGHEWTWTPDTLTGNHPAAFLKNRKKHCLKSKIFTWKVIQDMFSPWAWTQCPIFFFYLPFD